MTSEEARRRAEADLAAMRLELGRTQKHLEQSEVALDDARELLIRAKHQSKASEAFCDDVGTFLAKGTILHPIIDSIRARAQDAETEVASLQRDLAASTARAERAEAELAKGKD